MAKVLSFFEFQEQFGTEKACLNYLIHQRWPDGFVCPRCGGTKASFLKTRDAFQCSACRYQASVTAGTLFHKHHLPLRTLFLAVYLFATNKRGISALELQRKCGIHTYRTAWLLLHKLRKGMDSSGHFPLQGAVEVDETFIGPKRHGKTGRGAEGKTLVAVAVETQGKTMGRAYLEPIPNARKEALGQFVKDHVEPGSTLKTDGLASYKHLQKEYNHRPISLKDPEKTTECLPKVHLVITNAKAWMRGTLNRYPAKRYLERYLDEFAFRFNRRWKLETIFDKLLTRCLQTTTITLAELKA